MVQADHQDPLGQVVQAVVVEHEDLMDQVVRQEVLDQQVAQVHLVKMVLWLFGVLMMIQILLQIQVMDISR
jgi:hypothetical protein